MAVFDEKYYLQQNPDVAAAIKSGAFDNASQHYELYGKNEGRSGFNTNIGSFDENYYLKTNPDVAAAVTGGGFKSGLEHYLTYGSSEGRSGADTAPKKQPTLTSQLPTYERRDDSVTNILTGLTSKDSPLMQQAQTSGLKLANRRGLLNSSMAVGAAQDSAYTAAVPIAQTEAGFASAENLANLSAATQLQLQSMSDEAQNTRLGQQLANQTYLAQLQDKTTRDLSANELQTQRDLTAQELQTQRDLTAQELASRMQIQQLSEKAQTERLTLSEQATLDRLLKSIESTERQQQSEITYQTAMQSLDRSLQEKLASWNIAETQRDGAARYVVSVEELYQNSVANVQNNTNLDAETRTAYLDSYRALRDKQMNVGQQLYDVKLDWA